ncbi:SurA N-terminal domain-containing protein [Camelimonas fluminis]|uniref:Parvulin-like PPIase n=1 Tax=Camelimonas fluminis TaxID=1576911 RepID=A0ABV7UFJ4_9HYPH|nr:peptidylprolyl isomerase [Camelimonas fluminis]
MLQGMRNASKGLLGKVVLFVLFGLLIVSFAIWGIGDMVRGGSRNTVAMVGKTEITMEQLRTAWQNELQRLSQQYRTVITPAQGREMGLDAIVLGRLVTEAAMDQEARDMNLGVTDAFVVETIAADPNFRGVNGQFDRARFAEALRNNGFSEAAYLAEQRNTLVRRQIPEGLAGGIRTPAAMNQAVFRVNAERRAASWVALPAASVGEIAAPSDEALKSFFESRKASFRAPEFRTFNAVALTPAGLVKAKNLAAAITDAEIKAHYEETKESAWGSPERRRLQQMSFPDEATAKAAVESIRAGKPFEAVAKERGVPEKDLDLGEVTRAQMIDPAVRDAAFALASGAVSDPVKGKFGVVVVRAASVTPATIKPLAEVAGSIRTELAAARARKEISALHDRIEDQRINARPLAEIARDAGLTVVKVDGVDNQGKDRQGTPSSVLLALPGAQELLRDAFNTDVGADNEALGVDGGYVWYEVTNVEAARDRTLEEARASVEKLWREDQVNAKLTARADEIVRKVNEGATLQAASGLPVRTASDLRRGQAAGDLDVDAVRQIFSVPAGKAGSASKPGQRIIFQVTSATLPPFSASAINPQLAEQMNLALTDDLLSSYVRILQNRFGVSINQQNLRNAIGSAQQ